MHFYYYYCHYYYYFFYCYITIIITIIIIIIIIIIVIIITKLIHSKTILENTVEIESQPAALDFKNISQYFSRSK